MKNHKILFISTKDIKSSVNISEIIPVIKDAFEQLSAGKAVVPIRTNIPFKDEGCDALVMPAYLPDSDLVGVKLITLVESNPKNGLPLAHALITVMDAKNGLPLAILDGEYLTALRTGAASGVATDLLARKNSQTVAIFGAGVQGRTQLQAVCAMRDISRAYIFDSDSQKVELYIREMSEKLNLPVESGRPENLLPNVDIICTATPARNPLFEHKYLKSGVHLNAIGAYRPDMCEIPAQTVKAARVFADSKVAVLKEPGDIVRPLQEGIIKSDHIVGEIGEVSAGVIEGRQYEKQITFFKSVGTAVQDLAAAGKVIEIAKKNGLGTELDLA